MSGYRNKDILEDVDITPAVNLEELRLCVSKQLNLSLFLERNVCVEHVQHVLIFHEDPDFEGIDPILARYPVLSTVMFPIRLTTDIPNVLRAELVDTAKLAAPLCNAKGIIKPYIEEYSLSV
ncbi:hypothetical protein VNI00_017759 [Paramarasmius palmivorus]|uniref:Uncharacterized protein n=1 Tax=Paramarasmius palmivorus TaxID=297713 RepID=A0AAW0B3G4_9AGAR